MEELKRFQGSTFDGFSRRKLLEDRDTILGLTAKIQELEDAVSIRSGQSHVTSQPACFSTFSRSWRNAKPFSRNAEPQRQAAKYLGHAWYFGKRFANPTAFSSAPYPQESNPWVSNVSEHTSPHVMSDGQTPALDQRCQSGPSARNSFVPSKGRSSNNYVADQQRLQISDPHFDKFTTPVTFACWKIRFTISYGSHVEGQKKWRWLNQWMISNLRVLFEEFEHQTLKYSTRRLLQH